MRHRTFESYLRNAELSLKPKVPIVTGMLPKPSRQRSCAGQVRRHVVQTPKLRPAYRPAHLCHKANFSSACNAPTAFVSVSSVNELNLVPVSSPTQVHLVLTQIC